MTRNDRPVRCVFIGFAVPEAVMDELSRTESYPQVAANKFQWNLIKGLEAASGGAIDLISALPVGMFPGSKVLFVRGGVWKHREDSVDRMIGFVNLLLVKQCVKFLTCLRAFAAWLMHNRGAARRVLVYGMQTPHAIAAWIGARVTGASLVLIVPDLPAFTDVGIPRSLVRRLAKPVDHWLMVRMLTRMDGLVVLTEHIGRDFAADVPFVVLEGAVADAQVADDERPCAEAGRNIAMYAGALTHEYGVDLLLDAFSLVSDPEYELWIAGRGEQEGLVQERSVRDPRIKYFGYRSSSEVSELQARASFLVNPRRSAGVFNRYSFPSKVLDYMWSGRVVVTTDLAGIPSEYKKYVRVLREETPEALAAVLMELATLSPEERDRLGSRARTFVLQEKSARRQGERLWTFLNKIDS